MYLQECKVFLTQLMNRLLQCPPIYKETIMKIMDLPHHLGELRQNVIKILESPKSFVQMVMSIKTTLERYSNKKIIHDSKYERYIVDDKKPTITTIIPLGRYYRLERSFHTHRGKTPRPPQMLTEPEPCELATIQRHAPSPHPHDHAGSSSQAPLHR